MPKDIASKEIAFDQSLHGDWPAVEPLSEADGVAKVLLEHADGAVDYGYRVPVYDHADAGPPVLLGRRLVISGRIKRSHADQAAHDEAVAKAKVEREAAEDEKAKHIKALESGKPGRDTFAWLASRLKGVV